MNETTKDKKIRILKALASIPGQTGSIEAIRRKLKPPLDVDEIQKFLAAMEKVKASSYIRSRLSDLRLCLQRHRRK
jgi:predicted AAA+ superfamily ATPase